MASLPSSLRPTRGVVDMRETGRSVGRWPCALIVMQTHDASKVIDKLKAMLQSDCVCVFVALGSW